MTALWVLSNILIILLYFGFEAAWKHAEQVEITTRRAGTKTDNVPPTRFRRKPELHNHTSHHQISGLVTTC